MRLPHWQQMDILDSEIVQKQNRLNGLDPVYDKTEIKRLKSQIRKMKQKLARMKDQE